MRKKPAGNISNPDSLEQIEKEFSDCADTIDKLLTFDDFVVTDALRYFEDSINRLEQNLPKNHPHLDRTGVLLGSNVLGSLSTLYVRTDEKFP